ncbi:hypothetical protein Glove_38g54 [Diversispora epigaea]|uniref:C2H2-type domain-containing protein n=1 Tax=Diversispora epigaea TaxID=1348612 RepID=A0A397JRX1_9GLOM|nr:hypothetical protein Glove_38g54 [Diversispora epigaea]
MTTCTFPCLLCSKIYDTKKKLQSHERTKHKNNKSIPHYHILDKPSEEILSFYRDAIIIRLKSSLGFNRHSIGKKHIVIDAFPESVFLSLFENENSFKYIPSQRKYQCILEGAVGGEILKSILKYNQVIFRENKNTSTKGYILLEDNDGQYKLTFIWRQKEWKENDKLFLTGILSINFITNSGGFINDEENQILPSVQESSSNGNHILHTINKYNVSSILSQSNNNNVQIYNKPRYRYILPYSQFKNISLNNK